MQTKCYFIEDTSDHTVRTNQKTWRPLEEIKTINGLYIFKSKESAEEFITDWIEELRNNIKHEQEVLTIGRASSLEAYKRVAEEEDWISLYKTKKELMEGFLADVRDYNELLNDHIVILKQLENNVFVIREIELKIN